MVTAELRGEMEAQREGATCPRSHSKVMGVGEDGFQGLFFSFRKH
jgi:hypothetical protein